MSALIGALRVSLSADSANFEAGMKRAQRQAATSSRGITQSMGIAQAGVKGFLGALSVGLISTAISKALDYAASLGEVSQQLGVTTKDLQALRYAAGQVGVSQEELEKGLQKLTISMGQVAAGAKAPTKALEAIGLSAKDVAGLNAGDAFRKIADGLAPIKDRAQRAAIEVALFGRAGAQLDNLLSGGSGALNELSDAAERLGIVLSDEQIQKADDTADKLEAVKTVLASQIAGVVADNANSILSLASSLGTLTGEIIHFLNSNPGLALGIIGALAGSRVGGLPGAAIGGIAGAYVGTGMQKGPPENVDLLNHNILAEQRKLAGLKGKARDQQQAKVDRLKQRYAAATGYNPNKPVGSTIKPFLASPGGGGSKKTPKADHSAEDAKRQREQEQRDTYQFDQDMRRSQMDTLQARKDLSLSADERASIDMQLLDLDRQGYKAQLDFDVATTDGNKQIAQARADQLLAEYDKADALKRQAIAEDLASQKQQDMAELVQNNFDIERDLLEKQANLAETASERRDVELRILNLAYQQEKARLEAVIADKKSSDLAKQEAQARLNALGQGYALDRQSVVQGTRGPMEDYLASVPDSAAKMQEALERVKVNGIDALVDGLTDAATGVRSLGDVFRQVAQQIIADLLRIQIQKMVVQALSMVMGGGGGLGGIGGASAGAINVTGGVSSAINVLPGFATGGSFSIMGNHGTDRNMLSLNGLPIARVSHGERLTIGNDNQPAAGGGPVHIHVNGAMSDSQARKTGMQVAAGYQAEIARSKAKGIS